MTKNKKLYTAYIKIKGQLNRIDYTASAGITAIEKKPFDSDNESVDQKVIKKYTTGAIHWQMYRNIYTKTAIKILSLQLLQELERLKGLCFG